MTKNELAYKKETVYKKTDTERVKKAFSQK